ncbi:MAG: oligoendopeptidase F [Sphaerochaetaceae bacterium]
MTIKQRSEVEEKDKWNLSSLFATGKEWEEGVRRLQAYGDEAPSWKGRMAEGRQAFLDTLTWYGNVSILSERVGCYAMLCYSADASDPANVRLYGIASQVLSSLGSALSWFEPELLAIPKDIMEGYRAEKAFAPYRVYLKKELRAKAHVLSETEERLLSMQAECSQTPHLAFSDLTNVDMNFGTINGKPLTQSTYSVFMTDPDRSVRKQAYEQFYSVFEAHQHAIARLYEGSVQEDIFHAKARSFPSSRARAFFPEAVSDAVYDGLVGAVHQSFDALHHFYDVKRKALGLDSLAHWDVYVPMVRGITYHSTYDEAVETVCKALLPLGSSYVSTIHEGLSTGGWVDRYENKGKRSGAFSSGCYTSKPYILLNFTGEQVNDLFTMIHEGGHSMHSYYSKRNNPFFCYDYTIFEAEVASTFNEQLLFHYLYDHAGTNEEKAFLLGKQLDDIVATLYRQVMFAEFEDGVHKQVEGGEPLTVESLRTRYRGLLEAYFGDRVEFTKQSDLEGLRIPHFYTAYYVYKYATGISAAIALSQNVLNGGKKECDAYLSFLKSGGSRYPMDSLRLAGVNMEDGSAVKAATNRFAELLAEFERLAFS